MEFQQFLHGGTIRQESRISVLIFKTVMNTKWDHKEPRKIAGFHSMMERELEKMQVRIEREIMETMCSIKQTNEISSRESPKYQKMKKESEKLLNRKEEKCKTIYPSKNRIQEG